MKNLYIKDTWYEKKKPVRGSTNQKVKIRAISISHLEPNVIFAEREDVEDSVCQL